ncbi:hypothetical protein DLK05_13140 [Ancylomarina longa]|uniref:LTD domain-containing protein n=1 Tax=Ancylomarina longa TaxID=2487017 RepID=A0A434AGN7_9BACT|nr:hypothetical protein DLK05_13140 [Ancylomarina longa]
MKFADKECLLGVDTIPSQGYILLCSTGAKESLTAYGKVLGVSNFPSLTNTGGNLEIESGIGEVIDQVNYSDIWYKSAEKSEGGWSLERIDPMNVAWQNPNWTSSKDSLGGTPGKINSSYSFNADEKSPDLEQLYTISERVLHLCFSEPIKNNEALNVNNYKLSSDISFPEKVFQMDTEGKEYELIFRMDFIGNQKYELQFSKKLTDLANNPLQINNYEFWMPVLAEKGDIVINELLFNPYPGGVDYLELWNVSDNIIDLSTLQIASRDENYNLSDVFNITKNQELIRAKQFVLLTVDSANICENYYTCNPSAIHVMSKMPSFNDHEGRVVLLCGEAMLDDFAYTENMHFQLLNSLEGVALERIDPNKDVNNISNWQSAAQNIGFGTPGLINSSYQNVIEIEKDVSLSSKLFTPDNDGIDDKLFINFKLDDNSYLVNIRIYNSIGKEIRALASNVYLAKEDQLAWDGLDSENNRLPIGVYLLYIEIFNTKGDVKIYKKPCVIGGNFN